MKRFFFQPIDDLASCMEQQFLKGPHRLRAVLAALIAGAICWFVYVPIHELLHVAGCELTGGDVSELELLPRYGGTLLSHVFSFVVPAGDYAGRVTGFETYGSDLIYLATDIAPFLLSIFIGVPLIHLCIRTHRPWLFGPAMILGLAPLFNVIGDYYEMGSIITTRVAGFVSGQPSTPLYAAIRSDDIFRIIEQVTTKPDGEDAIQFTGGESKGMAGLLIAASAVMAVVLAFGTYALGTLFAKLVVRQRE